MAVAAPAPALPPLPPPPPLARDSDLDRALKSDLYGPFAGRPWLSPPPRPALSSGVFT